MIENDLFNLSELDNLEIVCLFKIFIKKNELTNRLFQQVFLDFRYQRGVYALLHEPFTIEKYKFS